ncbi:MAG: hypothetical protein IJH00_00830 [Erysipelotrichaceae bacterium]|nr:hypothetical protein [Erysipelotrichaceae bacterium]MBQ6494112.1 hypothetical protein [Erysipelotrichaceae bacterium]
MKENKTGKKIGLGIMAGLASVSVILGGLFDSAQELKQEYPKTPKAVIESIEDYSEDNLEENERVDSFKEKLKKMIYRIPVKVRICFLVPLWALGTVIIALAELAFKTLIAPFAHIILGFLLQTLILFAVIGICIKILFPDLPWSKIFNKKTFLIVIIGSLFMSACDYVVPKFWKDYTLYRNISKFVLGLIVILIVLKPFIKKKLADGPVYEILYNGKALG